MQPLKKPPNSSSVKCLKFITHTTTQIHMITFPSSSPNSSIFWPSGVFSSSSRASITACWILPISVSMPVRTTQHSA